MPRKQDHPTDTPSRRQIIRGKTLAADLGVTLRTVQRWELANQFPRRVKLGPNSVGYFADEVEAWKAGRERHAGEPPAPAPGAPETELIPR